MKKKIKKGSRVGEGGREGVFVGFKNFVFNTFNSWYLALQLDNHIEDEYKKNSWNSKHGLESDVNWLLKNSAY